MSISDALRKIKARADDLLPEIALPLVVVCIGLTSFGLGRLSATEEARPPVTIGKAPGIEAPRGMYPGGEVVASRSGRAYYFPWCGGVSNISPAKLLWFKDEQAARQAGYAPAKNCKGLGSPSVAVE